MTSVCFEHKRGEVWKGGELRDAGVGDFPAPYSASCWISGNAASNADNLVCFGRAVREVDAEYLAIRIVLNRAVQLIDAFDRRR